MHFYYSSFNSYLMDYARHLCKQGHFKCVWGVVVKFGIPHQALGSGEQETSAMWTVITKLTAVWHGIWLHFASI